MLYCYQGFLAISISVLLSGIFGNLYAVLLSGISGNLFCAGDKKFCEEINITCTTALYPSGMRFFDCFFCSICLGFTSFYWLI